MKPLEVLEPKPDTEKIDLTSPDCTSGCTRSSIFCICVWVKSRLTVGGAETRISTAARSSGGVSSCRIEPKTKSAEPANSTAITITTKGVSRQKQDAAIEAGERPAG